MADTRQKIFMYLAHRHFDLMPPAVRARYDDYASRSDFTGNMKKWHENYENNLLPDLVTGPNSLTDTEWEELYKAYNEAFQGMNNEKDPSIGLKSAYNKSSTDFIKEYFEAATTTTKVFTTTVATSDAETILSKLHVFLSTHTGQLKDVLTHNPELKDVFSNGFSWEDLLTGLRDKLYNSDLNFREKVTDVVRYIKNNGPMKNNEIPSRNAWPEGIGYKKGGTPPNEYVVDYAPPHDNILENLHNTSVSDWFELDRTTLPTHIESFKNNFQNITDTLLTNGDIRKHFLDNARQPLARDTLQTAIAETDYTNKETKDFLPEKLDDDKTFSKRLSKFAKDTYEDHLRRFVDPSRGTRLYFSVYSQEIMKAFDKNNIKPVDGLKGILDKKDSITAKLASSPNATQHFKWFVEQIESFKEKTGDDFETALKNARSLRSIVSHIIVEAVKAGDQATKAKAKTAMEVLSVCKYSLMSSKTLDNLKEATKDASLFSDEKLSWNKDEGIRFVTKAMDKTARAAVVGLGMLATGIRNSINTRRTKFGKDVKNNKDLDAAYNKWLNPDKSDAEDCLKTLANGAGKSKKTIKNDAEKSQRETELLSLKPGTPEYDNLQADIQLYEDSQQKKTNSIKNPKNKTNLGTENDPYHELIAYWDMLESRYTTHAFSLGSMKVKRKAFLAQSNNRAQQFNNAYGQITM